MKRKRKAGIHWRNLTLLLISFVLAGILLRSEFVHQFVLGLGTLRYIGIVLAGMFFVSSFTIAPASIVLYVFAQSVPFWLMAILGGFGSMIGDYIMFEFFKDGDLDRELYDLFKNLGGKKLMHILHSRHFHWMLPVIGGLIIISPLPDELGVTIMGISKLSRPKFLCISFILNVICVCMLLGVFRVLHL